MDTESVERALNFVASRLVVALSGFRSQKELRAVFAHPWPDEQFRVTVSRRGIDVIHAVFQQDLQRGVRLRLRCAIHEGGTAKQSNSALVAGAAERSARDQNVVLPFKAVNCTPFCLGRSGLAERKRLKPRTMPANCRFQPLVTYALVSRTQAKQSDLS